MKMPNQPIRITLTAVDDRDGCTGCVFETDLVSHFCPTYALPCSSYDRTDGRSVIWVIEEENDDE